MPDAIALGPVVLPTLRIGTLLLLVLAGWYMTRLARQGGLNAAWVAGTGEWALVLGLLGARLGFAAQNWAAYQQKPWTVLYLWQPGFAPVAGLITGAAFLLWRALTRPTAERMNYLRVLGSGLGLAVVLLITLNALMNVDFGVRALRPGDEMPEIRLLNLAGEPVELADYEGQAVVLNFWASWCGPCRREMPMLDEVNAAYEEQGAVVIGLDVGESSSVAGDYAESIGVTYPIWVDGPRGSGFDSSVELHQRYGGPGLPTTLFVSPDGTLHSVQVGELSAGIVRSRLDQLLGN